MPQKKNSQPVGSTPAKVQQSAGTENKRADPKTKSSSRPEPGSGKTRWGNVDSYDDTKDF